ncbi:unnamed protein product [Rhizophagus irregularis]|nr:unnamed protein product [Rhizophagus irregularis]
MGQTRGNGSRNQTPQRLKNFDLVWKNDNQLEKMKRGPYKTGKTPKSTYYDKYGPNGTLTKVAASTEKITNFFKISSTQVTNPQLSRADTLELEKQYNQLTVVEYNYKRTIFEYLTLLNNNNRRGRIDISLKVTQKIFIDGGVWKARKILYLTKYWLLNNKLPESRCRKHQKTIRIIDDEDVAERCHIWIRKQDFKATPALFKKFIETELFPSIGITREKSIALITAARCESMDQIHPNLSEGEKERILVQADIEKLPHVSEAARCYLKPGANQEGYWTAEHLLEQIEYKAIPIFETLYSSQIISYSQWCFQQHIMMRNFKNVANAKKSDRIAQELPAVHVKYWGAAKRYSCENCDYSWEGLQKMVSESLDSVTLITIKKFSRKCWRYMDLYRKGIDRKLVEYVVKKYKSHRRIPEGVLEELNKLE